ncbi:hypothetical protein FVE85_3478 [Porphyridium purpureum]|uniref:Uncharacterized protein n=1 Tax=Porphyridium purpureum TaxID=35688 RepID=A0A5J4YM81_PORPP|nr:hypothetical protein FVE85_3478 [Porphyridium purpureum]|eukprot:POR7315..scf249_10
MPSGEHSVVLPCGRRVPHSKRRLAFCRPVTVLEVIRLVPRLLAFEKEGCLCLYFIHISGLFEAALFRTIFSHTGHRLRQGSSMDVQYTILKDCLE